MARWAGKEVTENVFRWPFFVYDPISFRGAREIKSAPEFWLPWENISLDEKTSTSMKYINKLYVND